ncbi:MAG: UDP-N-acetylglucosamine 2-epimerase (non-hydrolyzing) [Bacteroidales bacterium]|jgi:UDP-GlcNAc3NAcA epimerase|nr:UDP-N-acetylglucosamine 2-epimerase (non-hydrolyzing) [Bacteroidales bacterium]MDX9926008.1 UDP-N-acetylglucosamine 2-epimerase (non-hydrolyzing) [Bacteroidales bacterium]HNX83922.1 UDP-N-acetylglucosamine 2-epimerase (non-hydrolyzing) [Bacteroidales bacterium]HPS96652.1 UDP-N-acetylglucosamine 2-epimerase (non-hydrolyzing) [Bacteroidales bacterium]
MKKLKILNIVGARPQIIKASAISRAIAGEFSGEIEEVVVHTGQHYDRELSDVFFDELEIKQPDHNLQVGSGRHGRQTGMIMERIEDVILDEKPDCVIIYGDTNSTLAAALAAAKQHFPVVHIEAGMRSFNKTMPEELNRIMADHASTLLIAPTNAAFKNLMSEGFRPENVAPYSINNPRVFLTGDIMYDNSLFYADLAERKKQDFLTGLGVADREFVLVTIHRDSNTDDPERLSAIFSTIKELSEVNSMPMIMPLHPRTMIALRNRVPELYAAISDHPFLRVIPPVSFLEMILLEKRARLIITDSGGVQKESHFFSRPCIVLRKETEWVELVKNGTVKLADANPARIKEAWDYFIANGSTLQYPAFYGDGKAAIIILKEVLAVFRS